MDSDEESSKEKRKHIVIKNSTDLQRMKLEKLMKNPEKPVVIPERPKAKGIPTVPDFVRNVMGSSAGAGSGEFHVYRHLRRKEYARQKYMQEKGERERLDEEYHNKLEEHRIIAEAKTAKKRAKRLKKKQKLKAKNKKPKLEESYSESESEATSDEEDKSGQDNVEIVKMDTYEDDKKEEEMEIQNEEVNCTNGNEDTNHTKNSKEDSTTKLLERCNSENNEIKQNPEHHDSTNEEQVT